MKKLVLIILIASLTACSPSEKEKAARVVAKMWNAQKCSVSEPKDTGNKNELVLTIENIKSVDVDYPKKYITSISAFKFLENISVNEIEGFTKLKVIVKNKKETFENSYSISDLIEANTLLILVDIVTEKIRSGNLNEIETNFDPLLMTDTLVTQLKNNILEIEGRFGKPQKTTIVGFEFDALKDPNVPVLIAYCEITNPRAFNNYKFVVRRADKKIIHVGINEK